MADDGANTFTLFEPELYPNWLRKKRGRTWIESHARLKDGTLQGFVDATKSAMTLVAPVDALPYRARTVNMDRGPSEDDATYRARLAKPFSAWSWAGTDKGVIDAYVPLNLTVRVKRNNQWDWDGHPGNPANYWARMWVLIDPPNYSPPATCGGGALAGDGSLCGISGITLDAIARIRGLARKWSDASVQIVNIIVVFVASLCGDGALAGGGATCGAKAAYLEGW